MDLTQFCQILLPFNNISFFSLLLELRTWSPIRNKNKFESEGRELILPGGRGGVAKLFGS